MAIEPKQFIVKKTFQIDDFTVEEGAYAGQVISRADFNSPGGQKINYLMSIAKPVQQGQAITMQVDQVEVTKQVINGFIQID